MSTLSNPSPKEFYSAFLKVVNRQKASLVESWRNDREHTAKMCRHVVPAVADELGMCHHIEYYQIDAVFFHERDAINFRGNSIYAKYISVAVEHENICSDTAVEMNRLQLLNAPLTVLITYPTKRSAARTLQKYAAIIQEADIFENASTKRKQMSIFGYPGAGWEAFVYQDGTFAPVILEAEGSTNI